MGCFVQGGKNGMGCFVRGDKNYMGCFVRGGKLMRDVLSWVSKNDMGCFVPECFVLHSNHPVITTMRSNNNTDLSKHEHQRTIRSAGGVKIQVRGSF